MVEVIAPKKPSFLKHFFQEHFLFYITAIILTSIVSAIYLLSTQSGRNSALFGLPLDDNWIHLVYARSLSQGNWFSYNPSVPEAGMSSPLWVVLLAVVYKVLTPLGVSPQWCAKGLSLFFAFSVPLATYHLARTFQLSKKWAWFAGLFTIIEPNLSYGNVAGMEVGLFTFLLLLALWLSQHQRYLLTGLVLGFGMVTRAEGFLNAIIIGSFTLLKVYLEQMKNPKILNRMIKLGFELFLPAFLLGGAWSLFNYSVNGHLVPNTYYVKHNFALGYFNLDNLLSIIKGYLGQLAEFNGIANLFMAIFLVMAIWLVIKTKQIAGVLLLLIPLVQLYAFSINIKVVATDLPWTYFTRRYMDFLLPLLIILEILGAAYIWRLASQQRNRSFVFIVSMALLGGFLLIGWKTIQLQRYMIEQYSWNTDNVEQVNVAMGKWAGENLPADATIGVTDAGALRFWTLPTQKIVDFLGLNCVKCIGRPPEELVTEFRPDYIIVFRQGLTEKLNYEEIYSIQVQHNTILGGNELVAVKIIP